MTQEDKKLTELVSKIRATVYNPKELQNSVEEALSELFNANPIEAEAWKKEIAKASKLSKKTIEQQFQELKRWHKQHAPKKKPTGEIDQRFYQPDLLANILQEIDREHKLDYCEKAALFLVRLSGELPNPRDRRSAALKGDSSTGKDNMSDAVLKMFPTESNEVLTHTTAAALRRSLEKYRCFAFSEVNKHRDGGANKEIVETLKQLAEGGINAKLCDKNTHEIIKLRSDQKTTIYGTTEIETDDELITRYIVIPCHSSKEKSQVVINDTLRKVSLPKNKDVEDENWCSKSVRLLDHSLDVIIPYANKLPREVNGLPLFDCTKPRIMRDVKRMLSLTKAIAWLYQRQRVIIDVEDKKYVVSEPTDFLTAYEITAIFFNLTYSGLDHRQEGCYKKIQELEGKHDHLIMEYELSEYYGWVVRHKLQEELGIDSINTIKNRILGLKDRGLVESHYDRSRPRAYLVRGVKQGVNKVSLPISSDQLTPYLYPPDTLSLYKLKYGKGELHPIIWDFSSRKTTDKLCVNREIDTRQFDTLNSAEHTQDVSLKEENGND